MLSSDVVQKKPLRRWESAIRGSRILIAIAATIAAVAPFSIMFKEMKTSEDRMIFARIAKIAGKAGIGTAVLVGILAGEVSLITAPAIVSAVGIIVGIVGIVGIAGITESLKITTIKDKMEQRAFRVQVATAAAQVVVNTIMFAAQMAIMGAMFGAICHEEEKNDNENQSKIASENV
jgi:hypothetical protein